MAEAGPAPRDMPLVGTPPTVDQAARALSGDFWGTFRFAQGEQGTQYFLFETLGATYQQLWTPEGMHAILPEALRAARNRALNTAPPVKHRRITPAKAQAEASKQWEKFSEVLVNTDLAGHDGMGFAFDVLRRFMPLWDARQVIWGRYDRPAAKETYASYYRTYVLDGQPTRSEAFDIIFASLRERQLRAWPPMTLKFLHAAWELRHKDEPFYPESFQKDLKTSSPFVRLGYLSLTRRLPHKAAIWLAAKVSKPRTLQTRGQPAG